MRINETRQGELLKGKSPDPLRGQVAQLIREHENTRWLFITSEEPLHKPISYEELADTIISLIREAERKRIEEAFIWGQVPYHDIKSGTTKEWTMHCISDKDWQALKEVKHG